MSLPNVENLFVETVNASYIEEDVGPALEPYEQGRPGLIRIVPDFTPPEAYMNVAKKVVSNIGNFKSGQITFLRAHYNSIPLALAVQSRIGDLGGITYMILFHGDRVEDALLRGTDEEGIKQYRDKYLSALKLSDHWTVVSGLEKFEFSREAKEKSHLFHKVTTPYWKLIAKLARKGQLKSYDMINNPTEVAADNIGMDFSEYQRRIFRAMSVDSRRLLKEETEFATSLLGKPMLLGQAIVGNEGVFELEIGDTKLTFEVAGRPVLRECGRAGVNVKVNDGSKDVLTNIPAGEVYVAPIESSVNGRISTNIPIRTNSGTLSRFTCEVRDGVVVKYDTDRNDIFEKDFPKVAERTVGEIGRGGFNKELGFLREIGKPTGDAGVDEKVYPLHIALGENTGWGGTNSASIHKDFSIPQKINRKNVPLSIRRL